MKTSTPTEADRTPDDGSLAADAGQTEPEAATDEPTKDRDAEEEGPEEKDAEEERPREKKAASRKRVGFRLVASPRVSRRLSVAALVLVFLTAVVTAGLQWHEAGRLAGQDRVEQEVRTRSAEFARALLAYRHTELPDAQQRIRALTSADFGSTYDTAFAELSGIITKYQADATATVRDVYLSEIDGQLAKTLVVLDSEVKSTLGVRHVKGSKLMLELVKEKGAWRVDAMTTLPADDDVLTDPDGKVTSTADSDAALSPTDPAKEKDKP
ncbi:hypothetical protein [Actinocorallia sp. A-T 12471]|uniref:hypothetical protein n=1 Tax=Actinocorallia sp. A-T 12471 TaxID=3089813 RepID=UPI0029CDF8FB|nr:hypothetical protein [Actinocorallia sp. A-T 12471]MDX6744885.1 hypothetical protein [Actinocorallia sp. A-T 12471]